MSFLYFGQDFANLFEFLIKISPGYHTAHSAQSHSWPQGYHTAHKCTESLMTPGVNHFLPLLHRLLKGQCHKNIMDSYSTIKGLHFYTFEKRSRIKKVFDSPRIQFFFKPKIRITQRNLNQTRIFFNPLVSGPGRFELWKKTGGRKSGWTVPLRSKTKRCAKTVRLNWSLK